MDGPRDYHTKRSKSERERQIQYDITYMWNLKYYTGASLVVQWLGLCLPMQGVQVQSLVGEMGSHMPHGQGTKKHRTEAML